MAGRIVFPHGMFLQSPCKIFQLQIVLEYSPHGHFRFFIVDSFHLMRLVARLVSLIPFVVYYCVE